MRVKKPNFKLNKAKLDITPNPIVQSPNDDLKKMKKRFVWGLVLSFIGIAIICAAIFWPKPKAQISANPSTPVIDQCNNSTTYSCYKKELTDIT
jgi:hypothetical protein